MRLTILKKKFMFSVDIYECTKWRIIFHAITVKKNKTDKHSGVNGLNERAIYSGFNKSLEIGIMKLI